MRNSSVRKNIRKNLPAYDDVLVDVAVTRAKFLGRLCAVIIAIAIPLGMLLAGFNIAFKIPDVYTFDLSRTLATKQIGYNDDKALIPNLMSGYLKHDTDSFILQAKMTDGSTASVFTQNDRDTMKKYRKALDTSFTVMCVLLPVSVIGYFLIYLLGRKRALKYSIRAALIIYLGSAVAAASIMLVSHNASLFSREIIGVSPESGDVLPALFGSGLNVEMFLLTFVISAVAMLLIFALTSKLTHGYKIFNRTDE
jgi:hypothetical protein